MLLLKFAAKMMDLEFQQPIERPAAGMHRGRALFNQLSESMRSAKAQRAALIGGLDIRLEDAPANRIPDGTDQV